MDYENKIKSMNLVLPPSPAPAGSYRPVVFSGDIAFLSGQIAKDAQGKVVSGRVGKDLSPEEGQRAAHLAALNVLSIIRNQIGFSKFDRMLKVVGYVQAAPDFFDLPRVVNGASDLFLEVFGEKGIHARSAVGAAALPLGSAVEIEVTLQIKT